MKPFHSSYKQQKPLFNGIIEAQSERFHDGSLFTSFI